MTENDDDLLIEIMELICCGERYSRCQSAITGDGTCERWTCKNEAEEWLKKSASAVASIMPRFGTDQGK